MTFNIPLEIIQTAGWCGHHLVSNINSNKSVYAVQLFWVHYILTELVQRFAKVLLLPVRRVAHQRKWTRLYYWSENKLYALRAIYVMPLWYYRRLYKACMWLVAIHCMETFADRAIHTIPYHVRFEVA